MPPHQPEYAPPVLRAPSPASSVGTSYGADQTSFSDSEHQLSQTAFERKWEERIGLGNPSFEEETANLGPLLQRSIAGSSEEKERFNKILVSLRREVQELEDNELFEQALLRGSQVALEQQPSTGDIDALMRSMMVAPLMIKQIHQRPTWSNDSENINKPWLSNGNGSQYDQSTDVSFPNSGVKAGKRSRNGSSRNP
ncbi:hypothetical protein BDZ94DRAFT_1308132 [Collybia nuda]|uniref:Uncharacterized protein n=1 Tax=Collybia nuda TaxID=64659 RepID=A0A9P5Y973_9AGAR|nr:hypothetical protein BDZ94DRAFT_1308132 [Collybia nuda]